MSFWLSPSKTQLAKLTERLSVIIDLPINSSLLPLTNNDVELEIISGELPPGLRLVDATLVGTPFEVVRDTLFTFVIRAKRYGIFEDRTYTILVEGPDEPVWVTPEGNLPVGANDTYFVLDSAPIDFQLIAYDPDTIAGDSLEYYIAPAEGELPPGITLSKDGRLSGITEPLLEIPDAVGTGAFDEFNYGLYPYDWFIVSDNGFETYEYDTDKYDMAIPTKHPNKLNRKYQFVVTISDGDSISKRKFQIYLVGDDFFRADNTVLRISSNVFQADNSYVRTPIWTTPSDLGFRRANNYITLFLDVIDVNTLVGIITYELQEFNPDGTPSIIPPGLELDYFSGELAGRVPYQAAVTKEYKFTLRALRRVPNDPEVTHTDKTFTIKIQGEIDSFIEWITPSDLGTINSNFNSNIKLTAETTLPNGIIRYTIVKGKLPPGLHLSYEGDIIGKVQSFGTPEVPGMTVFDNQNLKFDFNQTTIDRQFSFTVMAADRAGYSSVEKTFKIKITDPDDLLYSNLYIKPLMKEHQREYYKNLINNTSLFDPDWIYRPGDPAYGIQKEMRMLLYAGIETKTANHYVAAMAKNSKRKRYRLGEAKTAVAKMPGTQTVVYEVVYVDVIDPSEYHNQPTRKKFITAMEDKITVDKSMYDLDRGSVEKPKRTGVFVTLQNGTRIFIKFNPFWYVYTRTGDRITVDYERLQAGLVVGDFKFNPAEPWRIRPVPENTIKADFDGLTVDGAGTRHKFISNIHHLRENIRNVGQTEIEYLPLWMRSQQPNMIENLGYVKAIPLCYTKPGYSADVLAELNRANIVFNIFDFDIDRALIDTVEGVSGDSYLVYHNYSFNV